MRAAVPLRLKCAARIPLVLIARQPGVPRLRHQLRLQISGGGDHYAHENSFTRPPVAIADCPHHRARCTRLLAVRERKRERR